MYLSHLMDKKSRLPQPLMHHFFLICLVSIPTVPPSYYFLIKTIMTWQSFRSVSFDHNTAGSNKLMFYLSRSSSYHRKSIPAPSAFRELPCVNLNRVSYLKDSAKYSQAGVSYGVHLLTQMCDWFSSVDNIHNLNTDCVMHKFLIFKIKLQQPFSSVCNTPFSTPHFNLFKDLKNRTLWKMDVYTVVRHSVFPW